MTKIVDVSASDAEAFREPQETLGPIVCPGITVGTLICSLSISCVGFVGPYLYTLGYSDIANGLKASGSVGSCGWKPLFEILNTLLIVACILRTILAPSLWTHCFAHGPDWKALNNPFVLCWCILFSVPFLFLSIPLFGLVPHVTLMDKTIRDWPTSCKIQRPFHGLFQTRCWAALGSFLAEGLWHLWILVHRDNFQRQVGAISVAMLLFYFFMCLGGPVLFLSALDDIGQCDDAWISITYLLVTSSSFLVLLLLLNIRSCVAQAVKTAETAVELYTHWAPVLFNVVAATHLLVLEVVVRQGKELKAGPPWAVCGRDFKEFYFPRHKGLIYYCYAQLISFNLWILGCSLWSHECEIAKGVLGNQGAPGAQGEEAPGLSEPDCIVH